LAPVPRQVYEGVKLTRLDQILSTKNIGISRIQHGKYVQQIVDGKLLIEPCPLADHDFEVAELMFGICINLWSYNYVKMKSIHTAWRQLRSGKAGQKIVINLHRNS